MASIYDLLRQLGHKGGPANGRPQLEPGKPQYPMMNLSPDQQMAPHTLAAVLSSHGPRAESSLKSHLTAQQAQRRALRQQQAVAAGLPADVAFYGPHADPRAQALLKGGTGLGRGLGAAQAAPPQPDFAAGPRVDPEAWAGGLGPVLAGLGRRDRRARRRGYNVS
jgi:hypothetical protein